MSTEQELAEELVPAEWKRLSREQVSEVSGYTVQALADLASRGRGPAFLKPGNGRNVIYPRSSVVKWLAARAVIPTSI